MGRSSLRGRRIYDPTIVSANVDALGEAREASGLYSSNSDSDSDEILFPPDYDDRYHFEERQQTRAITEHIPPQTQKRCSRSKVCVLFGLVILAVAVITPIAVVTSKNKKSSASSSAQVVRLEPLPDEFESRCAVASPAGVGQNLRGELQTFFDCKKQCEASTCCDLPPHERGSCLRGNEQTCFDYHRRCQVIRPLLDDLENAEDAEVDADFFILPAPADIQERCSYDALSSSEEALESCRDACYPNLCCYEDLDVVGSGSCSQQEECYGYSPCMNLRVYEWTIEGFDGGDDYDDIDNYDDFDDYDGVDYDDIDDGEDDYDDLDDGDDDYDGGDDIDDGEDDYDDVDDGEDDYDEGDDYDDGVDYDDIDDGQDDYDDIGDIYGDGDGSGLDEEAEPEPEDLDGEDDFAGGGAVDDFDGGEDDDFDSGGIIQEEEDPEPEPEPEDEDDGDLGAAQTTADPQEDFEQLVDPEEEAASSSGHPEPDGGGSDAPTEPEPEDEI